MKTEAEIVAKLEENANKLEELSGQITALEAEQKEVPEEIKQQVCFALAAVYVLGWVMDCEEELKDLDTKLKLAGVLNKLKEM